MCKQRKATIWSAKLFHWSQYDRIPLVFAAEVSLCAAYGGHLRVIVARARSGLDPTPSGGSRGCRWCLGVGPDEGFAPASVRFCRLTCLVDHLLARVSMIWSAS